LTVETRSGDLICEFEKRPDTGGVQQDIRIRLLEGWLTRDLVEKVRSELDEAGFPCVELTSDRYPTSRQYIEIPLYGRREDLGLDAVRVLACVARVAGLPNDASYTFALHGGYLDSKLLRRLTEDSLNRPDADEKTRQLERLR
jgi:hypothetical protein